MQYEDLDALGQHQYGLVTRSQLLVGRTGSQVDRLVRQRQLIRVNPAVYRLSGAPYTWRCRLMAAQLWNPNAVVSHFAALHIYGIDEDSTPKPEVTVPDSDSARRPGLVVHRSKRTDRFQVIGGLNVTNVARTLIDVSTRVDGKRLVRLLENALFERLTSFFLLKLELSLVAKRGRPGVGIIRDLVDIYDPQDDKAASRLERDFRREMRRLQMPEPHSQYEVWADGRQYFLDFAYPELKIGIEAHSVAWHTRLSAFENDADRDGALTSIGWRIFYVTHNDMTMGLQRVQRQLPAFRVEKHPA